MTGLVPVTGRRRPGAPTALASGGPATDTLATPRRQWERPPPETDEQRKARLKQERRASRRRRGVPRRLTLRVLIFFLLVAAVAVGAYAVVRWYATQNWYVTVTDNHLVVYQGRPGGMLGFHPQLVDRSDVTTSQVLPGRVPGLKADVEEPSLARARAYIANLANEYHTQQLLDLPPTTVAPPPTTTTTTAPPATAPGAPVPFGTPTTAPGTPTTAPATAPTAFRRGGRGRAGAVSVVAYRANGKVAA